MDIFLYFIMLLLGLISSFFSGLLGIGGAIINYPLLLFVPPILGFIPFSSHEVSSISMFQVFFASAVGFFAIFKKGEKSRFIHKELMIYMGSSSLFGSLIGGFASGYLHGHVINIIYGILAIIAAALMLIPNKGTEDDTFSRITFSKGVAIVSAFLVGILSGVVGAGGGFMLIPIMLTVLKIPARVTIVSSLPIVFISAIGGVIGKLTTGHLPILPIVFTVVGSLFGAYIGLKVSSRINVKVLRYVLFILISMIAIKIWISILV